MRTDKAGDGLKASDPAAFIVVERGLTAREQEIVMMFASGRSATYIAETLFISISTVRTHLMHSYEKLGVHSRQELINVLFAGER
nr:helix-turn-helix transcriptional regulator [Adlercreutzia caecimuris]